MQFFLVLILSGGTWLTSSAKTTLQNLQVEYAKTPLGIDVQLPRFIWQMSVSDADRGYSQLAYQLVVTGSEGKMVWDSKKINDGTSLNIQYAGSPLQPTTKYNWTVTVWDQNGKTASESSWLYSVDQGVTTIWERLNSYTVENGFGGNNSMNSFSHYSFGAVGAWMYNYSLGIQRDEKEPGFKHFILQPTPDPTGQMTFANGHYDSMYGRIESGWKMENGKLIYTVTVPANTTATLYLPAKTLNAVKEGSNQVNKTKGISNVKFELGKVVAELTSGTYTFVSEF